jgi:hypothetical protein
VLSALIGRSSQYAYFASQHAIIASLIAVLARARARAATMGVRRRVAISSAMNNSHRADGASVAQ